MENEAVFDAGPLIHLSEISLIHIINLFRKVLISPEVKKEVSRYFSDLDFVSVKNLNSRSKDIVSFLISKFSLDLGEAEAIALCLQEKVNFFLTDDLDARLVGGQYGLEVHGTLGILTRAFREGRISKKIVIEKINELYEKSSFFLTKQIVEQVIAEVENF